MKEFNYSEQLNKLVFFLAENSLPDEEWKELKELEGIYFISSKGRIVSLYYDLPLVMSPFIDNNGYKRVTICKHHKRIHRLVAEAFIENDNPKEKKVVHHKDGNKRNNDVSNLEWVTYSKNTKEYYNLKKQKQKETEENGGNSSNNKKSTESKEDSSKEAKH